MNIDTENMVNNELRKAALLMLKACEMNMDLTSYGEVGVNESSGYVYLWLEDYAFTLYIPPSQRNTVYALWTNTNNGDEIETPVKYKSLDQLIKWCTALDREHNVD
jgi:hypothetical protein